MSDTAAAIITSVITGLKANAGVTALVSSRIYSDVPNNPVFPFIMVSLSSQDFSSKTETGMQHTLQVSCYSRAKTIKQVLDIRQACYNYINRNEAGVSPAWLVQFTGVAPVFKESDGETWAATAQFKVLTGL